MKEEYNVDDHAQHIFETDLDGFLNFLAVTGKAASALYDYFNDVKNYKNTRLVNILVKKNKWKKYVFDALEKGHEKTWAILEDYAQKLHHSAHEEFDIEKFEQK